MAVLSASSVVVAFNTREHINGRARNNVTLTFGNGTLTYPAGGIPLSAAALGCPNTVESLTIFDQIGGSGATDGVVWSWDKTGNKLRSMYYASGSTALAESPTSYAPASASFLKAEVVGW